MLKEQVHFTPEQIKFLDKQFPEVIAAPTMSEAEIRFRTGQRSVVVHIAEQWSKESR